MKVKRFEGRTFGEVMQVVKKELGKDAVIVSTESVDGVFYVTAAQDYEIQEKPATRKPIPRPSSRTYSPAERMYAGQMTGGVMPETSQPVRP